MTHAALRATAASGSRERRPVRLRSFASPAGQRTRVSARAPSDRSRAHDDPGRLRGRVAAGIVGAMWNALLASLVALALTALGPARAGEPGPDVVAPSPEVAPAPSPEPEVDPALAERRNRAIGLRVHAQELARAGSTDAAIAALVEAISVWPAYPLALNELGVIYAQRRELARAEVLFQEALSHDPAFLDARANLAEVQRRLGRFEPAVASYRLVLEARPADADALYGLAASLARLERRPQARWAMERYLEVAGESAAARVAEVRGQLEGLEDVDAEPPWELVAAAEEPTEPPPDVEEPGEAAAEPPPIAVAPGEPGPLPRHAGDAHYRARRYQAAVTAYDEALAERPDDVVLLYKAGAAFAAMNDLRAALRYWRRALALEPDRELLVRHVGLAVMKLGSVGRPRPPAFSDPLEAARIALIEGEPALALTYLADVDGDEATQLSGEARLLLGDHTGARRAFEALLAAKGDDRDATGGLAEALAREGAETPAQVAMRAWLGDREVPVETFLVLRGNDFATRLTSEPEE